MCTVQNQNGRCRVLQVVGQTLLHHLQGQCAPRLRARGQMCDRDPALQWDKSKKQELRKTLVLLVSGPQE